MTLTKADIRKQLSDELGLNRRESREVIELFFEEIKSTLERGESVKISGFGNFELRNKKSRPGRNLKTGEAIAIVERRVVTFKSGKKLKARVAQYAGV